MSKREHKEKDNPDLRGLNPKKSFYLAVTIGNLDGSIEEFEGEGVEGHFDTEGEAIEALKDINGAYPTLNGVVFYCVPTQHVWRGDIRVTAIKANGRSKATRSGARRVSK